MFTRFGIGLFLIVLVTMNLIDSLPIGPPIRNFENTNRRREEGGFAESPKVLEIQLPVKIATKDDLIAWAKYVMGLMASRINVTLSSVKEELSKVDQNQRLKNSAKLRTPSQTSSRFNSKELELKSKDFSSQFPATQFNGKQESNFFLPQYPNFGTKNTFDLNDDEIIRNTNNVVSPPAGTYLPVPISNPGISGYRQEEPIGKLFFDDFQKNLTNNFQFKTFNNDDFTNINNNKFINNNPLELSAPIRQNNNHNNNNLTNIQRNTNNGPIVPLISVPFEAVITITREQSNESLIPPDKTKNLLVIPKREPPDEFPPYFERNYTLIDQDGQINVIFDDFVTEDDENNSSKKNVRQEMENKKKDDKKKSSNTVGELLQLLGVLRRNSQNETNVRTTSPILKIIKGMTSQKVQTAPPAFNEEISVPAKGGYGPGGSGLDLSTLISTVVSGLLAGTSAGLSGSSKGSGYKDSAYSPTSYGDYGGYGGYGAYGPAPANTVNPVNLLSNSIKGIINGALQLVGSLLKAVTGVLGASSQEPAPPAYGPPPGYGPSTTRAPAYAYNSYVNAPTGQTPPPPPRQTSVRKRII